MPFLNLDLDYEDHPKTKRLVGLLGRGAELIPIRIWSYCGKYHAENGEMTAHSPQEIESIVKWWGKPKKAVEALLRVGFLEKIKGGFRVHDWKETQGHIHALKLQARHAANKRWADMRGKHAVGIPPAYPEQSPVPFRTEPSKPLNVKDVTTNGASPPKRNGKIKDPSFVEEVIRFCSDPDSRGGFITLISDYGEGLVREAMGEVKMMDDSGNEVRNRGAFITDWLKKHGR